MYLADLLPYYQQQLSCKFHESLLPHSSQLYMFWFRRAASSSQDPSVIGKTLDIMLI